MSHDMHANHVKFNTNTVIISSILAHEYIGTSTT